MTQTLASQLDTFILRAAVSGRFQPRTLLLEVPAHLAEGLAGDLSLVCDEDLAASPPGWILQPAIRRQMLARLNRIEDVEQALKGAPISAPDDYFGIALRALLRGDLVPETEPASAGEIERDAALHAALQFAMDAPAVDQARRQTAFEDIRGRIGQRRQREALDIVLPSRLFGRQVEMTRLRGFIGPKSRETKPLLITGIGGVGKSALVAAAVREALSLNITTVLLDFDRLNLGSGDPLPMAREFCRQLETAWLSRGTQHHRKAAFVIADIRERLREMDTNPEYEKAEAQQSFILAGLLPVLQRRLPRSVLRERLVLVLDTFEAIGGGETAVRRMLELEGYLRSAAGLRGLRTIVSGRAEPLRSPGDRAKIFGAARRGLQVLGLDEEAGAAFLEAQDRNQRFPQKAQRRQASRVLGGHPLALQVLERFARDAKSGEVERLLADLNGNSTFSAELAQAFVYTRILERLRDPELRALAHPGLVLRELSADTIRLLLAGRCGLGTIDATRAQALLDKLTGQYWLVEEVRPGVLRHRPDLRKLMLPGLFAPPLANDNDETAQRKNNLRKASFRVCHAAAAYYAKGPPKPDPAYDAWSKLPDRARKSEAIYYRALAGVAPPPQLGRQIAADLVASLGDDIGSLPATWRAAIKIAREHWQELTADELATLKGDEAQRAQSARAERALKSGRAETIAPSGVDNPARMDLEALDQALRGGFATATFSGAAGERLAEVARVLLDRWSRGQISRHAQARLDKKEVWTTGLWQAALLLVTRPNFIFPLPASDTPYDDVRQLIAGLLGGNSGAPNEADPDPDAFAQRSLRSARLVDGYRLAYLRYAGSPWHRKTPLPFELAALSLFAPSVTTALTQTDARLIWSTSNRNEKIPPRWGDYRTYEAWDRAYTRQDIIEMRPENTVTGPIQGIWRGLAPELHEPASYLFKQIPPTEAARLANQIAQAAPVWPEDLWFVGDHSGRHKPRPYEAPLAQAVIQTADRCGVLHSALELLSQQRPVARHLMAMHEVLSARFSPQVDETEEEA